jgi:hypothetical protein
MRSLSIRKGDAPQLERDWKRWKPGTKATLREVGEVILGVEKTFWDGGASAVTPADGA